MGAASLVINVSVPLSWPCVCVCACVETMGLRPGCNEMGMGCETGGEGVCGRDWKSKQEPQTAPDASTTQIDANICISTQYVE